MQLINPQMVQELIDKLKDQDLYIHLEMTTGAYASHNDESKFTASTFIKNGVIRYSQGSIAGMGSYRVGLKLDEGWIYSQGLTHFEETETQRLIMAGHDSEGKLVVALQLGKEPF
ncbi:YojF family protein [Paenibacillus sp.]|uniref:YojF family protein n=1 Tax=Paenibacillus sp. TaxID=58172 RepID=UPI002819A00C|nr:YojF family protein [Paenibacillus sp.]MDR0270704.1 YojF family protein [Paenibacillus sp.]